MPPKINLATILLGFSVGFKSLIRSRLPLAAVEQVLPPVLAITTVIMNGNDLWINMPTMGLDNIARRRTES
jgi:hypothetical protein